MAKSLPRRTNEKGEGPLFLTTSAVDDWPHWKAKGGGPSKGVVGSFQRRGLTRGASAWLSGRMVDRSLEVYPCTTTFIHACSHPLLQFILGVGIQG